MSELPQIIKLDATDSTNVYLKQLSLSNTLKDYTTVITKKQTKGRGQMGTSWQSEEGKNLTFSVLKIFDSMPAVHQFALNICVSLAVYDVLKEFSVPEVKVKWPNDIMSGSSKICGILIENVLKGHSIKSSIIGIGLNVNQTSYENLEKVTSLKSAVGRFFDLEELLHKILRRLEFHLSDVERKTVKQLLPSYTKLLFRKDKPSTFKDGNDSLFMGFIRGISPEGKLTLELEDEVFKSFGLKEVSLLY